MEDPQLVERLMKSKVEFSQVVPKEDITHTKSIKLLNEYKSLLDSGIITQEEFDAKKKELLGL